MLSIDILKLGPGSLLCHFAKHGYADTRKATPPAA
jgi:hypothetical protein